MRNGMTAKTADRHALYEEAVQNPFAEIRFIRRIFKHAYGRYPLIVREDFCGTAFFSCEWVKHRRRHRAIGVDLEADVLSWARRNNLSTLGDEAGRVKLMEQDVMTRTRPLADVVAAFNFSYCVFKTRCRLLEYFTNARKSLKSDGCLVLDLFGGPESQQEVEEHQSMSGFTYIWDQAHYNPITTEILCHIHFQFPDHSMIRRAFTYDWRLWTIPEIVETLAGAGFSRTEVFWEGADSEGEANGVYRRTRKGTADPSWVCYIVGIK